MQIPKEITLVLAGGNALGAYHAGAYEALHENGIEPAWIAGASIGAVTAAIILGNPPEQRLARLRDFWRLAEQFGKSDPARRTQMVQSSFTRSLASLQTLMTGRPGLFAPRLPGAWSAFPGAPEDVSIFDTLPLTATLSRLIDFDRLNSGAARLTATAIDVETGEDVYFDTQQERLAAEHLRASAAFPVVYPPVEIGGRMFVDPGLSANLPLGAVLSDPPKADMFCIAVDLVSASGRRPKSLGDAVQRAQDLLFAKHSLHAVRSLRREYRLREVRERATGASRQASDPAGDPCGRVTLLHVAYSNDENETAGKMFDYSAGSVRERWAAGYLDMRLSLDQMAAIATPEDGELFAAYRFERGTMTSYPED